MTDDVPWLNEDEQRIWRQWLAVGTRLDAALGRQLQHDNGLSHREYEVLVNLSEARDGRLRMTELADAMQWERSRLSHQIARMAARGLVERRACPEDRRGVFVAVTDAGRSLLTAAAAGHVRTVRRLFFDALSPQDLGALDRFSAAVLDLLAAEAADAQSSQGAASDPPRDTLAADRTSARAAADARPSGEKDAGHTPYARMP